MASLPRAAGFDHTASFITAPYTFIGAMCDRLRSDVFETRLFLTPTICMRGEESAALFYDEQRFQRAAAAPNWLTSTLLGHGGVQGLDGATHRERKALLLSLLDENSLLRARRIFAEEWTATVERWELQRQVVLYEELHPLLTRVACAWTGIPLSELDVGRRARDLVLLFDAAGAFGPRHLAARRARRRIDQSLERLVRDVRNGAPVQRQSILESLARSPLDDHTAAVELCNLIRPVVALSVYIVFLALALHEFPGINPKNAAARLAFIQEVRRYYPFFPAVVGRVKDEFQWKGMTFPAGRQTFLDLYGTNHHPRAWLAANQFVPVRFLSAKQRPYAFVPQGGGDAALHHRCAGEQLTLTILDEALVQLVERLDYQVLARQDLRLQMGRLPALPRSRFILHNVRSQRFDALGRRASDEESSLKATH